MDLATKGEAPFANLVKAQLMLQPPRAKESLEFYLYWNHPSREFHRFNGPYYGKNNEEELRKHIEELKILLVKGEKNVPQNKKIIANKDTDKIIGQVNWYWKSEET
ncbi:MAG TPA: hypothetical protein VMV58_03170, partial [Desulfosporosinus sp.]|nr:hypothetical protein [Desulfosporosinus sp.]